uniref:Uncharacterized protein n=1 Tax=Solanum lycopersicum TaxID=4081 RepID=A0A3Q7J012_SOLLC
MADLCRVRRIGCSMIFDALPDHHITCDVQFSDLVWSLKKTVEEAVLHIVHNSLLELVHEHLEAH